MIQGMVTGQVSKVLDSSLIDRNSRLLEQIQNYVLEFLFKECLDVIIFCHFLAAFTKKVVKNFSFFVTISLFSCKITKIPLFLCSRRNDSRYQVMAVLKYIFGLQIFFIRKLHVRISRQ